jgi:hypothetical protein
LESLIAAVIGSGVTSCFGFASGAISVAGTGTGLVSGFTSGFGSGLATGTSDCFGASADSTTFGLVEGIGLVSTSVSASPMICASGLVCGFSVGFGVAFSAFGAFTSPFCNWLVSEMISIGSDSELAKSIGFGAEKVNSPQPRITAWIMAEDATLVFMTYQLPSGRLTRPIFLNPEPEMRAMTFMIVP